MGCPTEIYLGDIVTFSICTHDPDTALLTDTDGPPSYRIYESLTGTALLSGSMAKLDDANTTGFYVAQAECSGANGFEDRKNYTIYIEATVNGQTGGIAYGFRVLVAPSWAVEAGALEWPYRLTTPGGDPISGADVWISTDAAGANIIWRGLTDSFGYARDLANQNPWLAPGTYYFWDYREGYTFTFPDIETVSEVPLGARRATALGSSGGPGMHGVAAEAETMIEWPYRLTTAAGQPIVGAEVQVSSDVNGQRMVWLGKTGTDGFARDAQGQAPRLAAGTYYFWNYHQAYRFTRPHQQEIG